MSLVCSAVAAQVWAVSYTHLTISVLAFLNSFKVFREAYLVAGDYPDESMYLLQHLFNNWFRELSLDKLSAAAIVVSMIIFLGIRLLEMCIRDRCIPLEELFISV